MFDADEELTDQNAYDLLCGCGRKADPISGLCPVHRDTLVVMRRIELAETRRRAEVRARRSDSVPPSSLPLTGD